MRKKLTFNKHKSLAKKWRKLRMIEEFISNEVLPVISPRSRLARNLQKVRNYFPSITSELEKLYYRDTTEKERDFPYDLIYWISPNESYEGEGFGPLAYSKKQIARKIKKYEEKLCILKGLLEEGGAK